MTLDVLAIGRIGIDLYPEQSGVDLHRVRSFRRLLGGSPTNVAAGAARLGLNSAILTKVGDDGFGAFARDELRRLGVDARWVGTEPGRRTPLAFAEFHPPDDFPLLFYRDGSAPDLQLRATELPREEIGAAGLLWTTGGALCAEPSRGAVQAAIAAAGEGTTVILDLDYRPALWSSQAEARDNTRAALAGATVAVGNASEAAMVVGEHSAGELASRLLDLGPELAIVKLGPQGVLAASADGAWRVAPIEVDVINGLGAGDAFGAALCHGLLARWPLQRTLGFANAAGAVVATRFGCAEDMPTVDEVEELLGRTPSPPTPEELR